MLCFSIGLITRMVPTLVQVCQGIPLLKKNATFKKVLQLGPFEAELTNAVNDMSRVSM